MLLKMVDVTKSFAAARPVVDRLSLTVEAGEFFCLLGPSGCGKSTLLKLVGGYVPVDGGTIHLAAEELTTRPPEQRQVGMVFQNYALFPHLSAFENVAFGLRVRRRPAQEIAIRAAEVLDWVGLTATERRRRPAELSGGQQQRVALARALVLRPRLLMLDEPFANLDRQLRERLRQELQAIQRRTQLTTILVTHDREEAISLADRVGIMHSGRLLQVGTPREVYEHPQSEFVATFMGPATLLKISRVTAAGIETVQGVHLQRSAWPGLQAGDALCVRPEAWRLNPAAQSMSAQSRTDQRAIEQWPGTIVDTSYTGSHTTVSVRIAENSVVQVELPSRLTADLGSATAVTLGLSPESACVIRGPVRECVE